MLENKDDTNIIYEDEDFDTFSDSIKVEMINGYYYYFCSNCESLDNSLKGMKNHMVSEH